MKGVATKPEQKQRVIRVFISSTFQDMKEEREELVKRVFPRLRKICEERGVTWGAIDLRWGITDEQHAEGMVLPICLKQIDECRPFFIGILGERYGYIPDDIHDELIEQKPWLKEQTDKSVTELEMLHGVLNDPEEAEHVYFYFRDPAWVKSMPEIMQADDPEKLGALKSKIRASGIPVRENYPNPKELGKLVYDDLTGVIDQLFPVGSELDPLDRDTLDHELYAYSKFKIYIGRQEYFDLLDQHVASENQPLVVLGESGSGKSALLANWATKYKQKHPGDLVLSHFIGATPYSADWSAMVRRIMGEFKRRYDIAGNIPGEPDKLRSAFANWLHMASAAAGKENKKIVLILDALNQLEDRDQAPDLVWLPPFIPLNVRMILSTLPGRPLDDLKKREWATMEVKPLVDDERKELTRRYLGQYQKELNETREERIHTSDQTRNPLFLRALLEELRVFGVHEHLDRAIEHYIKSPSIPDLYQKVLGRLEGDYDREWPGLVEDAMTFIWASRRGLSEGELLDLLGAAGNKLPHAQWVQFHSAVEKLFVDRSDLIELAHDYIRKAISTRYLQNEKDRTNAHLRIADYFLLQELTPRKIDELPWQLAKAKDWQWLFDLLAELDFFKAAWEEDKFEVKAYWARIKDSTNMSMVEAYQAVLERPEIVPDKDTVKYLSSLLADTGYPMKAQLLNEFLIESYRQVGKQEKLAACLQGQALILMKCGKPDDAMVLLKEQEQIYSELQQLVGLHQSLGNQAIILMEHGDFDGTMVLLNEKLRICQELGDLQGLAHGLGNKALILWMRGDLDTAMELHKDVELTFREFGDRVGQSASLGNQALIHMDRGEMDKAMELLKEKENISRELGDLATLQIALGNQASILKKGDDLDGAMALLKEQERICRSINHLVGVGHSLGTQSMILREQGLLNEALDLIAEEERIARDLGRQRLLSTSIGHKAVVYKDQGKLDQSLALLKEVELISRKVGLQNGLAGSLALQADVLFEKKQPKNALPLAEEAYEIATKYGYAEETETSKTILDKIRAELGQTDST